MQMQRTFFLIIVFCMTSLEVYCQVLQTCKVSEIHDPVTSLPASLEFDVTLEPGTEKNLQRLEIRICESEDVMMSIPQIFPIVVLDGTMYLTKGMTKYRFENNRVQFRLDLKEKKETPYVKVLVQAVSWTDKKTNEVIHQR
jgi:hypothetical protein